ncbi:MAG TPA: DUF2461 domain-containing protein [Puia sp.]|jgi:uncharacterized protein (TIGR02453 family)|nr:DUF2461 domain-containing protein [Puia sp.]
MRINPGTFDFLKKLAANNNREWFQANKAEHDTARQNIIDFAGELIKKVHLADPQVDADLDPKKCVMRIYRDIRFRIDKTPYKTNFGISIPTIGSKSGGVEYYFQIQPGKSFIAGGYWMPETDHLKKIRQEIDYNAAELKKIIDDAEFKKLFGNFREQEQLKTAPREYSPENENIDLLKLKSFIVWHQLKDKDLMKTDTVEQIVSVCSKIYPLNVFLRNAMA